jgi:stalled ribosome rescue protein Dom34
MMKREVGLWIDHRQAVIVILSDGGEEIKHITSNMEKHTRFSNASHAQTPTGHDNSTEDKRDRRFDDHLDRYYDEVIALLHDADSILIMGPGEAKGELQKRLAGQDGSKPIAAIETTDKLTDGQIAAAVRQHFGHGRKHLASQKP